MKPTIGRIVHYSLPLKGPAEHEVLRPAMITEVFEGGAEGPMCNLTVFLDQANDLRIHGDELRKEIGWAIPDGQSVHAFPTSVHEGTSAGTWRWPARAA